MGLTPPKYHIPLAIQAGGKKTLVHSSDMSNPLPGIYLRKILTLKLYFLFTDTYLSSKNLLLVSSSSGTPVSVLFIKMLSFLTLFPFASENFPVKIL